MWHVKEITLDYVVQSALAEFLRTRHPYWVLARLDSLRHLPADALLSSVEDEDTSE